MKVIEDRCVQCGLPCLGKSCPNQNVVIYYCDYCQIDEAEYQLNDKDICNSCAEEYLNFCFEDMSISDKAMLLGVQLKYIRKIK